MWSSAEKEYPLIAKLSTGIHSTMLLDQAWIQGGGHSEHVTPLNLICQKSRKLTIKFGYLENMFEFNFEFQC
jgi:hypothetical protein